jgi:diguanylate cyclase (GGDEF)-like protein
MKPKTKLLFFVAIILLGLGLANLVNVLLNFRETSIDNAIEKSKMAAGIVQDGLTAHMVNGMMDQRRYFLDQISKNKEIKSLWIVRGENVVKQYGEGLVDETTQDDIDKEVLKSGIMEKKLMEDIDDVILRVSIPYIATENLGPNNCLKCHNVKRGDVLGAISMEFDINKLRMDGVVFLVKIMAINLLFVIIFILLINYFVTPYTKLFANMQEGIKKAYKGDFTHKFSTTVTGDGRNIVDQLNVLFSKMQESFGNIRHSLAVFAPKNALSIDHDPLSEANQIITELSDIYKFKKTIELDISKDVVYSRIINIFKEKYGLKNLSMFIINDEKRTREIVYNDQEIICSGEVNSNSLLCRSYRTETNIVSSDFENLCQGCKKTESNYSCFFYSINDEYSMVVSMVAESKDELKSINEKIPNLKNYLEAEKPVIESKLLMEKLKENSLKDGMTGIYNRRFLEEFVGQFMRQADRNKDSYHVLMIDIDYFKNVNDTYGHDIGDKVIIELSDLLKKSIRSSDMAIRYGGEEFIVMLHNSTDEGAMIVAKNLHSAFSTVEIKIGMGESIFKTISIGMAKYPKHGDTIWKCIKCADTALYEAKENGRNQIVEFEPEMLKCDLY